jgi:hypothetical protein
MDSKGNNYQSEETAYRMEENVVQLYPSGRGLLSRI